MPTAAQCKDQVCSVLCLVTAIPQVVSASDHLPSATFVPRSFVLQPQTHGQTDTIYAATADATIHRYEAGSGRGIARMTLDRAGSSSGSGAASTQVRRTSLAQLLSQKFSNSLVILVKYNAVTW